MAEAVVDRLEVVEIDQQHGGRARIGGMALRQLRGVLQERAAIGDAGERIDHGGGRWRNSVRSFAIASRMKAIEIVNSSASNDSTVSHTLPNMRLLGDHGSMATSGVRSRNSAPCANSMKIAGQRDTSGSLRPRQNS